MRQINPILKSWVKAEKAYQGREREKAAWKKRMAKGREFLDGTHRYERTFSDQPVGETCVMNGREAKARNDKLFEDYLAAMDANIEGRSLEQWKVIERFVDANNQVKS